MTDGGRTRHVQVEHRDRPARVLVLSCCDGRYIDAVEQLLTDLGEPHHDLIAFPGGPANLLGMTAGILEHQAVTESLDFMLRAHRTEILVLIAHQDCAYYQKRYGSSDPARQEQDLHAAAAEVTTRHRGVRVVPCFLRPLPDAEGGGVAVDLYAEL